MRKFPCIDSVVSKLISDSFLILPLALKLLARWWEASRLRRGAFVIRSEGSMAAHAGLKLHEGDVLRTSHTGRIGVILRDDTLLSLGANSEMVIDEFVFPPGDNQMSMVFRLLRGMASYVSGKIAELAPEAVKIKTPVATVGVRGTRFLVRVEG